MSGWLGARVAAGIGIVAALLGVVVLAWWTRGVAEAVALFQLLQGVILATLGWLYGSQGLERAEASATAEAAGRIETTLTASQNAEHAASLVRDAAIMRRVLAKLAEDPALHRKIEELSRGVEER